MSIEITVPKLPESVADATLVIWHKKPGDRVARDENLADLETDKVVLEVPAPAAGTLVEIKVVAGTTVTSGQLLAVFEAGEASAVAAPVAAAVAATPAAPAAAAASKSGPAAQRAAAEAGVDLATVQGSAKGGRATKADVAAAVAAPVAVPAPVVAQLPASARGEHRVPMTRLRQRIAERLVSAQATQALLTTFNEVDLLAVNELRALHKDRFDKAHGVKLGFSSFFVKATIEALKKYPLINASVDGTDVLYHEYYDIGVAVSTDRGLVVPVLRDADTLSFADIEKGVGDFATRARKGGLTMDDLTGGTFSITNGGVFGSLLSTPIVNAPQSAILGMHKIQERPVAVNGQVVIRPMMYLALTYDHRIIDGKEAVQFLVAIKESLEDPGRLLIGV